MITGGVLDAKVKGEPGVLKLPPEYVKAACDEAHKRGLMVAAHVESPEGVRVALENGVDTIAHGAKADDEIISLFKEQHAALITLQEVPCKRHPRRTRNRHRLPVHHPLRYVERACLFPQVLRRVE